MASKDIQPADEPLVMTEEVEVPTDQTKFAEDLVIWDEPYQEPSNEPVVTTNAPKKSKLLPILGLIVGVLFLVTGFSLMQTRQNNQQQVVETPAPQNVVNNQSELDKQLQQLEQDIDAADPIQAELAFPPVDFKLELQDGTLVKQRLQTPSRNF